MKEAFLIKCLLIFALYSQRSDGQRIHGQIGCQQRSTSGRSYVGEANTTVDGIPCQKWSDTEPHDHSFTHVGDHNFCRNPTGASQSQVWCFTVDPDRDRQNCSVPFCPPMKALDFSLDNDQKPDETNSYTHASLQIKNLPTSFTVCTAFMVEAFTNFVDGTLFLLHDDEGEIWQFVGYYFAETYTEFSLQFEDSPRFLGQSEILFYPLQWTRVCLSKDPSIARLVADGELLIEKEMKVKNDPDNLNLVLGLMWEHEYPGQTTNLNIFASALTVEQMKLRTSAGTEECELKGDFLSWEESLQNGLWTLHSNARWVDFDGGLEGPCRAKANLDVFPMSKEHHHRDCMEHCEKLGGQSPSVNSKRAWENILKEVQHISSDPSKLPDRIWLSATEGDIGNQLGELEHWPEGEGASEGVWRDFYTGEQLENFTKPWWTSNGDNRVGDTYNCIYFRPAWADTRSWVEWHCSGSKRGCPCTYRTPPLIRLRGFCPETDLEHKRYTISHSASDPSTIIIVGSQSARIQYDPSQGQWFLSDPRLNVTATSRASQNSYALGKHNWTVTGDRYQCSEGKQYTLQMKLTGCNNKQFTCGDGQCIRMEERCNQMPDCKDTSDEFDCKILKLKDGYNKRVPPVGVTGRVVKSLKPVEVNISLLLYKVVSIKEEDHSIELQFQITLQWKENRATYFNLKSESYLNALSMDEINSLWLPLVVYLNTNQQETTRQGWVNEWSTDVTVKKEGNFTRSGFEVLDETYLFNGDENSLIMMQSYTHNFQCVYKLERYPFDTQVV